VVASQPLPLKRSPFRPQKKVSRFRPVWGRKTGCDNWQQGNHLLRERQAVHDVNSKVAPIWEAQIEAPIRLLNEEITSLF
jgi:hypothetical protein